MSTVTTEWTLCEIEEQLMALTESMETVSPEQEKEFLEDFSLALLSAVEKRDRVAHHLAHLEQQQEFAAKEISRLQKFKKERESAQARLEVYISYCIRAQGKGRDGKYKKLEGNTTVMYLRGCAASVEVRDLNALPLDYQCATVTLRASMLNELLNSLEDDFRRKVVAEIAGTLSRVADKRAIRQALEVGVDVPGAELITGKTTLGRR